MSYYYGPYSSQFGLAETIYRIVAWAMHWDYARAQAVTATLWRMLGALAVGAFVAWCAKALSAATSVVVTIFFALANFPGLTAGHLYWRYGTALLPFIVPWLILAWTGISHRAVLLVCAVHAGLLTFRLLFGYAFLTTLALAPLPTLVFYGWLSGKRSWGSNVRLAGLAGSAALLGFALAIALHITKGALADRKSPAEMIGVITERVAHRASHGRDNPNTPERQHAELLAVSGGYRWLAKLGLASPRTSMLFLCVYQLWQFANSHATSFPGGHGIPAGILVACLFPAAAWCAWQQKRLSPEIRIRLEALAWALAVSALGCLSWSLLAFNHFIVHMWQCPMAMYLGFFPLGAVFLSEAGQALLSGRQNLTHL